MALDCNDSDVVDHDRTHDRRVLLVLYQLGKEEVIEALARAFQTKVGRQGRVGKALVHR